MILIWALLKDIPYNGDDEDAFEDSEDDMDEGLEETTGKTMFIFTIKIFNDQKEEDNYHQDRNRQHNHLGHKREQRRCRWRAGEFYIFYYSGLGISIWMIKMFFKVSAAWLL